MCPGGKLPATFKQAGSLPPGVETLQPLETDVVRPQSCILLCLASGWNGLHQTTGLSSGRWASSDIIRLSDILYIYAEILYSDNDIQILNATTRHLINAAGVSPLKRGVRLVPWLGRCVPAAMRETLLQSGFPSRAAPKQWLRH